VAVSQPVGSTEVRIIMPTAKLNSNGSIANPLNWQCYVMVTAASGPTGCEWLIVLSAAASRSSANFAHFQRKRTTIFMAIFIFQVYLH